MGFIEDLERSIDIVELVGKYAKLKKAGTSYKALCPFPGHSERTPSFVVSPAKQIGYCFGCHKGGGPVKFIMDMENCEFREAVEILGQVTGREIQGWSESPEKTQIKKNLYNLYKDITIYYKQALKKNSEILGYLRDRGISEEMISAFHFGYADSGLNLYNYLREKGYDDTLIAESQVFLDIARKKDKFIGRVIFPIQNLRGDFVAFAGRIVGQGEPKYLNSPASHIYDKSAILYGLYDARSAITKKDFVIITEGYMDTIALHQAGFTNTVAVSGTALTEKHVQILKRLTHKIYLCFDNDHAGEQATRASLELLKNKDIEVQIILLSGGKDPDEVIKSGADFQTFIDVSLSPVAFSIKKSGKSLSGLDEKKKFLSEILELISSYADNIEKDMYLKEVAKLLDIHISVIYEEMKKYKQQKSAPESIKRESSAPEIFLISYIIENGENLEALKETLLFEEEAPEIWKQYLQNPLTFIEETDMETREKIKALALQFTENDTLEKIVFQVNKSRYKSIVSKLKDRMRLGEKDAFETYSAVLQIAKKHNLK